MDQKNHRQHPSHCDTHSFPGFQPWNTESFDVKKKRKLLIEQLSLPTPKLPRWGPSSINFPYGQDNFKFNKKRPKEEGESSLTKMVIEGKEMSTEEVRIHDEKDDIKDKLHRYGHEEDLLEFGSHETTSIYEQCCSDSTRSLLLPTDSKHDFVLSSGRWSIDREAESKTIRTTIDQEFEQYFSVLLPSLDP